MNFKKILCFIWGDKFNENPLPIIDSYIKEHGLTLLPHSTKNDYIIDDYKEETYDINEIIEYVKNGKWNQFVKEELLSW